MHKHAQVQGTFIETPIIYKFQGKNKLEHKSSLDYTYASVLIINKLFILYYSE